MRVDISNTEKVLGAINSLSQSIDACITTQTDVAIQTQAVNKKLGLAGIMPEQVPSILNKYYTSLACKKANVAIIINNL